MEGVKKRLLDLKESIDLADEDALEKQRKLKDATEKLDEAEGEVSALNNRKMIIMTELKKINEQVDEAVSKLTNIEDLANESEVMRKDLESREVTDDDMMAVLEAQARDEMKYAEEREDMLQEAERKLQQAETDLKRVCEKGSVSEQRLAELEADYDHHNTKVLQLENKDYDVNENEEEMEDKIKFLEEQVHEAEKRLEDATRQAHKTEGLITDTILKCDEQRDKIAEVEQKTKQIIEELADF